MYLAGSGRSGLDHLQHIRLATCNFVLFSACGPGIARHLPDMSAAAVFEDAEGMSNVLGRLTCHRLLQPRWLGTCLVILGLEGSSLNANVKSWESLGLTPCCLGRRD